jgi:hypothetical protein
MIDSYKITKIDLNKYTFTTDKKIKYYLIFKPSGIVYENTDGEIKNVLELSLVHRKNSSPMRDSKTISTLILFMRSFLERYDAVYFQTHNQLEFVNKIEKKRGISRVKLWVRIGSRYFKDHIILTNLGLNHQKKDDIPSLVIKKDFEYYKQIVTNFYRFNYIEF